MAIENEQQLVDGQFRTIEDEHEEFVFGQLRKLIFCAQANLVSE